MPKHDEETKDDVVSEECFAENNFVVQSNFFDYVYQHQKSKNSGLKIK